MGIDEYNRQMREYERKYQESLRRNYLKELFKEVKMDKAKFGIKYDRDEDPVEFFETTKEAEKRIKELLGEDDVDKESIYLFEVGNKWKVDQPVKYDLVEVK